MSDWRMEVDSVNLALQVNLEDFSICGSTRKMVGATFVDEQMQDDSIERWVLRVSMSLPVANVHVELDISLQESLPVAS